MSGFNIGLSGLRSQASAIEVTSNNVANASSVGFKSGNYQFVDQFFRQLQSGGAGGVSSAGTERRFGQGSIKATSSPLDLAIQGDGMFRLASASGKDASSVYYSRNGQFAVDKEGFIVNANGLYLTGYQPDTSLTDLTSTVAALRLPPSPVAPRATQAGELDGNLDSRPDAPVGDFDPTDVATFSHSTTMKVLDAKGMQHTVQLFFRRIEDAKVDDPRAAGTQATAAQFEVYVQGDGNNLVRTGEGQGAGTVGANDEPAPLGLLQFLDGQLVGSLVRDRETGAVRTPTVLSTRLADAEGGTLFDVEIDVSAMTAFGSAFEIRSSEADGYAAGALSGLTVDEQGRLFGQYTNGKMLLAGQLLLATFGSEYGLAQASANVFTETSASGPPILGTGLTGQFGSIRAASLEESNIDMAQELVQLMIQQRNYQANAQSIKAADEMLTTTIQLAR